MIEIDYRFRDYYKNNLKYVSLYLIDKCNLRCTQCFYKLELGFHIKKYEIDFNDAVNLITEFRKMGADTLTLIGGEPTLYGLNNNNKPLLDLIRIAKKDLKYNYVRIDTNGQFDETLLDKEEFKLLDEISFSLDGPNKEINDCIRGKGSFDRCINNIKRAKKLNFKTHIISCVSKEMIKRDTSNQSFVHQMILLAENLNVDRIDFHGLFKNGTPRDCYTGDIDIQVEDWIKIKKEIDEKIEKNEYKIPVNLPKAFIFKEEFSDNSRYYGYCSCKNPTRLFIQPNGLIRSCPLMIGTSYSIAKFYDNKIVWEESNLNELLDHKMNIYSPCTNQYKNKKYGKYIPLCIYR